MVAKNKVLEESRNKLLVAMLAAGKGIDEMMRATQLSRPSIYRIINSPLVQEAAAQASKELETKTVDAVVSQTVGDMAKVQANLTLIPKHLSNLRSALDDGDVKVRLAAGDRAVDLARNGLQPRSVGGVAVNSDKTVVINMTEGQRDRIREASQRPIPKNAIESV